MIEAQALFARALALEDSGRPAEALLLYAEILSVHPGHADAMHNRGLLLARLGRLGEAEQSHREYTRSHPQSARAWNDLADILLAQGDYHGAIAALESIQQPEATALVRLGVALSCIGQFPEAREAFKDALSLNASEVERFARRIGPGGDLDTLLSPENIFIARHFMAQGACEWPRWDADLKEIRELFARQDVALEPATAYMALLFPFDGDERHEAARHVAARIEAMHAPLPPAPSRRRDRIRLGILSPDFREHLNAYLLLPLFQLLDRGEFELRAYSLAPNDGSAIRAQIGAAADAFVDLHAMSDADAANAIRRDDIDILLDVAGHTTGGRFVIVARRPARIQASYLGFLGSLGSKRLDFAIVDPIIAPAASEWSEALVHLPHTFFVYDFRAPPPHARVTRQEYGLPGGAFVYCAFHQAQKVTPDTFGLWMEVLGRVPRSVLWFRALSDATRANLVREAAAQGIEPARLVFAPFEPRSDGRYFARQVLGDLLLDALHHNAITNACDALASGLPVLTLRGSAPASRAGESLARAADLGDLVAKDRDGFVDMAVRLGTEAGMLGHYRDRLAAARRSAPLFDTQGRVRELAQAFRRMMESVR